MRGGQLGGLGVRAVQRRAERCPAAWPRELLRRHLIERDCPEPSAARLAAPRLILVMGAQTDGGATLRGLGAALDRYDREPVAVEDEQRRHTVARTRYRDELRT